VVDLKGAVVIWLAWRQFRTPAYIVLGALAVVAVVLGVTGPHLVHLYDTVVKTCKANNDCGSVEASFSKRYRLLQGLSTVLVVFPALLGVFWGAPLVAREMESGTFRLAWTQSVTRRRWFLTRVGLVSLAAMVATGLFSLMVTWWSSPLDKVSDYPFGTFDQRDIVPIGYALFAVTLGVCAGAVIRRSLPAIGATLVGFLGVGLVVTDWVRPRLASALRVTTPFELPSPTRQGPSIGGGVNSADWAVSNSIVNPQGRVVLTDNNFGFRLLADGKTEFVGVGVCPNKIPPPPAVGTGFSTHGGPAANGALHKCVASFHLRDIVTYQPVSRYWSFQWYELTIYVALAVVLGATSYWWVRRRLS
jgi:hypothetical protein